MSADTLRQRLEDRVVELRNGAAVWHERASHAHELPTLEQATTSFGYWTSLAREYEAIARELEALLIEPEESWHHESYADRQVAEETELEKAAARG